MTAPVVNIWADGACVNNPGLMGIGAVVIDGDQRHELSEHIGMGTNNVAELTAIERGLALAFKVTKGNARTFIVHTDSKYAIGVLSLGWKAKANKALIARIIRKLPHKIGFVWVRGHSGVPENERCDHLATSAALGRTPGPVDAPAPPGGSYVESIAVDLVRVAGAQPGSIIYHGIVGALTDVVGRCAAVARTNWDPRFADGASNAILALASSLPSVE